MIAVRHHRPKSLAETKSGVSMSEHTGRFYFFVQQYLKEHTKPLIKAKLRSSKNTAVRHVTMPNIADLQSAAELVYLKPECLSYLNEDDYKLWAAELRKTFKWADRRPFSLWTALKQARQQWQHKCQEEAKPPPKQQPTKDDSITQRDNDMTRAYTAFSDVFIEDFSEFDTDISTDLKPLSGDENISRMCDFCRKETVLYDRTADMLKRLTGRRGFFCVFCVRNGFHTKRRKNVLILSLRGLIGYLYHVAYFGKTPRLYLSQLQDMIAAHVEVGQTNPLFIYDPETYCWFIDFASVSQTGHRVPIAEVIRTVNEMITVFNPYDNIKDFKSHSFTERFNEAIMDWHSQRHRPSGKSILAPTLKGCACETREVKKSEHQYVQQKMAVANMRDFQPHNLRLHGRR